MEDGENFKCKLKVTLPYNTPVVGVEFKPHFGVHGQHYRDTPNHSLIFKWSREHTTCSVHRTQEATIQCTTCIALELPVEESYYCSTECFSDAWQSHRGHHCQAAETVVNSNIADGDGKARRKFRSSGSWPSFDFDSPFDRSLIVVGHEGKTWLRVGSSESYIPSMDDLGFTLRLECVAVDDSGIPLSPENVIITNPVIISPDSRPRGVIQLGPVQVSRKLNFETHSPNAETFTVLSYNILSDIYANQDKYSHCPAWALAWVYRQKHLLQEIIGYDADILCLQEVQSNHFENFFKPELEKHGYAVFYKKKTNPVYTADEYVIDGCATFYRRARFKELISYELEFNKAATSLVDRLEPSRRNEGGKRLMKDNVALVVVLELMANDKIHDVVQSRLCVANTHIHANPEFSDVKLYQVSNLVNVLEEIVQSRIPLLVCGDMNSLPGSDAHNFLVTGRLDPIQMDTADPFHILQHLKLKHSIPLVSAYAPLLLSERVEERQKQKINPRTMEPLFTYSTPSFTGTLDYIFFTGDSLKVEGLLELLDKESVNNGLPSPLWSSDHIALMACFSLETPSSSSRPLYPPLPPNPWQQAGASH